ncbi:glutamate racemase [uncultured Mucilaginibacter sp.]|uniref:glutamate racemase n=1 Tax=uncultured Mucilaginibacter sp. TaxID=797541 RepID=UPI0025D76947|nr:glutamate racemase [uncultured Mucilaginibacter sp.]
MFYNKPIGIFDSGFGGLTVFRSIIQQLPDHDYIYLGDTARAPYGNRSFQTIHQYTWECVKWLFEQGCPLVILACNTASAKALRTIQQKDLLNEDPAKRVLGVIRPTAEVIGDYTKTKEIGVLGTKGTVQSGSYLIEIGHFFPDVKVYQQACPLWVPLIENGEHDKPGADYFVKKYLDQVLAQSPHIDTLLLACTHYPLLLEKIKSYLPDSIQAIAQGDIVAKSLVDYLQRHPEMESSLSKNGTQKFFTTTDDTADFDHYAEIFFGEPVKSEFAEVKG